MKYCTKCGEQNPDEAKFCKSCGEPFVKEKTQTRQSAPAQSSSNSSGGKMAVIIIVIIAAIIGIVTLTTRIPEYKESNASETYFSNLYATGPAGFRSGTEDLWYNTEMRDIDLKDHGGCTIHRPYIWVYDEFSKVRLEVCEYDDGLLTGCITYESYIYERCRHQYYIMGSTSADNWTFCTYDINGNVCDSYSGVIDKSRQGYENGYQYLSIFKGTCVNKRDNRSISFRMYEVDYGN